MNGEGGAKQLLHLVFGGELARIDGTDFADTDKLDIVGIYPELRHRLCGLAGEGPANR